MSKVTPNIGTSGVDSIRIGGMKIDDLPIAEAAQVKEELPKFIKNEIKHKIETIKAEYPKQTIAYINGALLEAENNIKKVSELKDRETTLINEYTSLISLCKYRDKEIAKISDVAEIKEINKQFPPYNVEAMQQQVVQSTEAINRADEVIAREYKDIAGLRELLGLCQQRDKKLEELGE